MRDRPHGRRVTGLTAVLLGLTAVFASLTLIAVSRAGLAAVFAVAGVLLIVIGLRWLPGAAS